MSDHRTLARPYAKAAFSTARDESVLAGWAKMLALGAMITQDSVFARVLKNPLIPGDDVVRFMIDLAPEQFSATQQNFIKLLAEQKRLTLLAAIFDLFAEYQANHEKTLNVQVISAHPLTDTYKEKIMAALTKKLDRKIELDCELDPELLGGALIRAGDQVFDGTVRSQLHKLHEQLID